MKVRHVATTIIIANFLFINNDIFPDFPDKESSLAKVNSIPPHPDMVFTDSKSTDGIYLFLMLYSDGPSIERLRQTGGLL